MPSTEPRSVAAAKVVITTARDYPKYETHFLHPRPDRNPNEVEIWLNELHGRIISVLNSPWDPTSLMAITQRWS